MSSSIYLSSLPISTGIISMLPFLTFYLCVVKLRSLCLLSKPFTFLSPGNVLLFDNLLGILLCSWYMYGYFACKPMPSAYGAQKKVSDPEILELQAIVSSHMRAGN